VWCVSVLLQEFFWQVGLGLGSTRHPEPAAPGQVTRKGISCERTFSNMSDPADLQAMVRGGRGAARQCPLGSWAAAGNT
jgi:hypothetical protein